MYQNSLINMMQNPNHKAGLVNCSPTDQTHNCSLNSNRYTKQNSKVRNPESILQLNSPYQHALSKIKEIDPRADDSEDFKTPPTMKKPSKLTSKISNIHKKTKCIKKINKNSLLKLVSDNFNNEDVHPETLQMALALSKSRLENDLKYTNDDFSFNLSNLSKFTTTGILEDYGFKSSKSKAISEKFSNIGIDYSHGGSKGKKNTKFRYITPPLLNRTEEDREALITKKLSSILSHLENRSSDVSPESFDIFSEKVKEYYNGNNKIIELNSLRHNNLLKLDYLVSTLNLTQTPCCCGCLLKKWEDIPGRITSPKRLPNTVLEIDSKRSVSPDLFESDDGLSIHENITTNTFECMYEDSFLLSKQTGNLIFPSHKIEADLNKPTNSHYTHNISEDAEIKKTDSTELNSTTSVLIENNLILEPFDTLTLQDERQLENKEDKTMHFNNTDNLNVTNYLNSLLNNGKTVFDFVQNNKKLISNKLIHSDDPDNLSQNALSQESITLSDEELNYSSMKSEEKIAKNFYGILSSDEEELKETVQDTITNNVNVYLKKIYSRDNKIETSPKDEYDHRNYPTLSLSQRQNMHRIKINGTDNTSLNSRSVGIQNTPPAKMLIRTKDVTPMANYDEMSSPQMITKLEKFGLKPLKRRRGIQLLKYMYEYTHPVVNTETVNSNGLNKTIKRIKIDHDRNCNNSDIDQIMSLVNIDGNSPIQNESADELVFEKKKSKKTLSCAIPLQLVWFNFLKYNPEIRKSILLYEPLYLEVIHSMLKEQSGYAFKLEDIINLLDKKCITFKTMQWQKHRKPNTNLE